MIIHPVGYTVQEWTDYVGSEFVDGAGIVPKLLDENDWRSWARVVCALQGVQNQHPPNPFDYEDWLSWAMAFNQVVRY